LQDSWDPHRLATPKRSTSNSRAENKIGLVEDGIRVSLEAAGLGAEWRELAGAHWCYNHYCTHENPEKNFNTPFYLENGEQFLVS
jgi:hypothetical protein